MPNHPPGTDSPLNLRPRLLLLTLMVTVTGAVLSWLAIYQLADGIVERWAARQARTQALYDSARLLQSIGRDLGLSQQLAGSRPIVEWALEVNDETLEQTAIAEMESYRLNFTDRSYAVMLLDSGRYYHNNADNAFAENPYRYTLDPRNPADAWFYDTVRHDRDLQLNVNTDVHLGVTKLWINVLIRHDGRVLGAAGTGLDLTTFIAEFEAHAEPGIATLLVDRHGAIQLWRDPKLIELGSIATPPEMRKTLDLLFDTPAPAAAIRAAMSTLETRPGQVSLQRITVNGRPHIAGVVYLPEIDWYEISLLDIETLLPLADFYGIFAVLALTLIAVLLALHLAVNRMVLWPIASLERAVAALHRGSYDPRTMAPHDGPGELGRLVAHFRTMAQAQLESTAQLEQRVHARTRELERLARIDPLTGLLNRRGMSELIEAEINRAKRGENRFGLLWLDVDSFKQINDLHGHECGDQVLQRLAELLAAEIRDYDSAARWGGDEFVVLLHDCNRENLMASARRLCTIAAAGTLPTPFTVSIGAALAGSGDDFRGLLHNADQALYQAKLRGRNRAVLFSAEPDGRPAEADDQLLAAADDTGSNSGQGQAPERKRSSQNTAI